MTWATIRINGVPERRLTNADVAMAVRAAAYEGGSSAAALWTWVQRWALLGGGMSLARIIQTHSQPVNPLWLKFGACCCGSGVCPARRGGNFCSENPCADPRIARRNFAQNAPLEEILAGRGGANGSNAKKAIAWAQARVPNPVPRAVDFAAPGVSKRFVERTEGAQVVRRAGNWFIATPDSARWAANHVTLELDGRVAGPRAINVGALAMAGGIGFVGYQWWKLRGA